MIKVAPSVLAADILNLGQDVGQMLAHGADLLHLDIMDGHFVPNLSYGPSLVEALHRGFPKAHLDVHLMLDNPLKYIDAFVSAGANAITVHQEAVDVEQALRCIKARGVLAGISIKPKTPTEVLKPYLDKIDIVLVMTVEPGFGGQRFMADAAQKVRQLRDIGYLGSIMVDGGVSLDNAQMLLNLGADTLVMGTALFKAQNRALTIQALHEMKVENA